MVIEWECLQFLQNHFGKKDIFITRVKRPLENIIIKRYLKKVNKKARDKDVF